MTDVRRQLPNRTISNLILIPSHDMTNEIDGLFRLARPKCGSGIHGEVMDDERNATRRENTLSHVKKRLGVGIRSAS